MPGSTPAWKRLWTRLAPVAPTVPAEPLVSVVIPVFNVAGYVGECLDSVLAQDHRSLQVIVIDDGSTDASPAVVQARAEADDRIEFQRQANVGLGATRNRAARLARGEFLFFLDSDDRLPKRAISAMVEAAQRTGADVVMGPLTRFNSSRRWLPAWASELHRAPEFREHLADRPELLRNHYACAKLYRRSFWTAQDARFREGVPYEDQPLVTRLLISADGIASVADPVYEYRDRDDQSSISQQTHTLDDLRARATAWRLAAEVLADQPESIRSAWLRTILGTHVHWYLDNDSIAQPVYWGELRDAVRDLDRLGASAGSLPPARELAMELLRADDRARYLDLRGRGAFSPDHNRVVVVGDHFSWRPVLDDGDGEVERPLLAGDVGTRLVFETARWAVGPALRLEGRHVVPGLELDGLAVRHELTVAGPSGSSVFDATPADPEGGAFAADVEWTALDALASEPGRLTFSVRSLFGDAVVDKPLPRPAKWFAARRLAPAVEDGLLLVPDLEAAAFSLTASRVPVWVERVGATAGGSVAVELAGAEADVLGVGPDARVPVSSGVATLPAALLQRLSAEPRRVELPLTVSDAAGRSRPLVGGSVLDLPGRRLQLRPDAQGVLTLVAHQRHAELADFRLGPDGLELNVSVLAAPGWTMTGLLLRSRAGALAAEPVAGDAWLARIAELPEGGYDLLAEFSNDAGARTARVAASPLYVTAVPTSARVGGLVWRALVAQDGAVHFDAHPPEAA